MILDINNILVSSDVLTEYFCCDLEKCKGECCIEGDAGAPVSLEEIGEMEDALDTVWEDLSASAQSVIDKQGVAYTDKEGDLVTSIVNGKDCVFTKYADLEIDGTKIQDCCLCAFDCAFREGKIKWQKPISCALYPIRVKEFSHGLIGLNYHKWSICKCGRDKGAELKIPVYRFLKGPIIQRFGEDFYNELCTVAEELKNEPLQ